MIGIKRENAARLAREGWLIAGLALQSIAFLALLGSSIRAKLSQAEASPQRAEG
jgi:hypothetical protein